MGNSQRIKGQLTEKTYFEQIPILYIILFINVCLQIVSTKSNIQSIDFEKKNADPNKGIAFRYHLVAAYQKL